MKYTTVKQLREALATDDDDAIVVLDYASAYAACAAETAHGVFDTGTRLQPRGAVACIGDLWPVDDPNTPKATTRGRFRKAVALCPA